MAQIMTVLVYGEECDRTLEELLDYFRTTLHSGYLDMFAHRFNKRSIFIKDLAGFSPPHQAACEAMRRFMDAVHAADDLRDYFDNADFFIKTLEIMADRLYQLDPKMDLTSCITRTENIQNNIKYYLVALERQGRSAEPSAQLED